jgi:8-oxo-dGTP diphosphatase
MTEPRVATSVIPIRDGKVLVGQRADGSGCWQWAGGKPEPGETLEECAARELREETGLETAQLTKVGPFTVEHRGTAWTVHFYAADVDGEAEHREPDKSLGWKWVRWDELPRPMLPGSEALLATGYRPASC